MTIMISFHLFWQVISIQFNEKESDPLKTFLLNAFDLRMNNNPAQSTTRSNTTIDGVFFRYLERMEYIRILL